MKCIICGKDHNMDTCPVCKFPRLNTMGGVSIEDVIEQNREQIDTFRNRFLDSLSVYIKLFYWEENNEQLVNSKCEYIKIGAGNELLNKEKWLDNLFSRIQETKSIDVSLLIQYEDGEKELSVSIPNIEQVGLQQIGAVIYPDMEIKLLLRNDQISKESEKYLLFQ